jgi:hypothetical protein
LLPSPTADLAQLEVGLARRKVRLVGIERMDRNKERRKKRQQKRKEREVKSCMF